MREILPFGLFAEVLRLTVPAKLLLMLMCLLKHENEIMVNINHCDNVHAVACVVCVELLIQCFSGLAPRHPAH